MARLKTIRAFDQWKLDPKNVDELFRLIVEERMSLRDAAIDGVKQPYTLIYPFVNDGGEMEKRYEAAKEAVAETLAQEALKIADEQAEVVKADGSTYDPDVPRDKLRVDTRLRLAGHWNRKRYGEVAGGGGGATVVIQVTALRGEQASLPAAATALPDVSDAEQVG